jgi:hypothetical protein
MVFSEPVQPPGLLVCSNGLLTLHYITSHDVIHIPFHYIVTVYHITLRAPHVDDVDVLLTLLAMVTGPTCRLPLSEQNQHRCSADRYSLAVTLFAAAVASP